MAPAEAMACGLPVVAAAAGPNVEFMRDQVTGILVNPALGAAAFAEAIQRLTDNEMLRRQMGDAARSAAVRLSWSRAATEVIDLYREVVARGQ
jgi:glycosyltransferase involved in cell wall biosynthesis